MRKRRRSSMRSWYRTRQNMTMLRRQGSWKKRNIKREETISKRCKGCSLKLKKIQSNTWPNRPGCKIGKENRWNRHMRDLVLRIPVEQKARQGEEVILKQLVHQHNRNLQNHQAVYPLVTGRKLPRYLQPTMMVPAR